MCLQSIPDGQSEFANMWKELQSSSTSSKPKETTKPITLDQAAAALDKVPSPQAPQSGADQKPPSTTLEQLFNQAKSAQEQTAKEKSPNAEVSEIKYEVVIVPWSLAPYKE